MAQLEGRMGALRAAAQQGLLQKEKSARSQVEGINGNISVNAFENYWELVLDKLDTFKNAFIYWLPAGEARLSRRYKAKHL